MKTVTAKKRLGQHFLIDLSIAKDIADTVDVCPALPVLEVGPGLGKHKFRIFLPRFRPKS